MLIVVDDIWSTVNPACWSWPAAATTTSGSDITAVTESASTAPIANIDRPPTDLGEAWANNILGRPWLSWATWRPAWLRALAALFLAGLFLAAVFFAVVFLVVLLDWLVAMSLAFRAVPAVGRLHAGSVLLAPVDC